MTRLQRPTLPTATQLLNHLFENPKLIAAVRELPGPVLGRFIDSVGLEDAAELVALATTQQLESIFDEDLWQIGRGGWEARAFLELARRGAGEPGVRDAITNAYFRDLSRSPAKSAALCNRASVGSTANVTGLLRLLEETNVVDAAGAKQHPKPVTKRIAGNAIEARCFSGDDMPNLLEDALGNLRETDPDCYRERLEELAYLANVLMAAPQNQRQRLRPVEALESALRITSRGLEVALGGTRCDSYRESLRAATPVLAVTSADCLFRRAFPEMCSKRTPLSKAVALMLC